MSATDDESTIFITYITGYENGDYEPLCDYYGQKLDQYTTFVEDFFNSEYKAVNPKGYNNPLSMEKFKSYKSHILGEISRRRFLIDNQIQIILKYGNHDYVKDNLIRDILLLFKYISDVLCYKNPGEPFVTTEIRRRKIYPLPNMTGLFTYNMYLYLLSMGIFLIGIPVEVVEYDFTYGCPGVFFNHDIEHTKKMTMIDTTILSKIYNLVKVLPNNDVMIFALWFWVHELGFDADDIRNAELEKYANFPIDDDSLQITDDMIDYLRDFKFSNEEKQPIEKFSPAKINYYYGLLRISEMIKKMNFYLENKNNENLAVLMGDDERIDKILLSNGRITLSGYVEHNKWEMSQHRDIGSEEIMFDDDDLNNDFDNSGFDSDFDGVDIVDDDEY
jgi:hypothetical protein